LENLLQKSIIGTIQDESIIVKNKIKKNKGIAQVVEK